ncbi:phage portal protein [Lactobacillus intestinalis]|uniref:phage portal protein n=1 Tax=Lactobacillus intestinalis TaxID=151781 RepID=UPI0025AA2B40|nr:phage portal protein [Lactobacillus intestinalis]
MPLFKIHSQTPTAYSLSEDTDIVNFLTGKSDDYVSANEALKNSDLFSLILQLSGDLATVEYQASSSRIQSLIDNPSLTTNGFSFWQAMFAQLLLAGNAYAFRWRNINGVDLRWEYLKPSQVEPMLLDDGSGLVYNITFDEPDIPPMYNVPQRNVLHFRLMSNTGGMTGISPLMALKNELQIKQASNRLTISSLQKSVEAPGVLTITGGGLLNWKKKAARSNQFMRQVNHSNGGPIVLDDLEDYKPLEVKSDVAKLLSQADWTGKQIAKVYGVPDSKLNGQGDQQSNIMQMNSQYAASLNRFVKTIVSELNDKLNTKIIADIRPAIDSTGDQFADTIGGLAKNNALATNQATYVLQQIGYLPQKLPQAIFNKGGEKINEEN